MKNPFLDKLKNYTNGNQKKVYKNELSSNVKTASRLHINTPLAGNCQIFAVFIAFYTYICILFYMLTVLCAFVRVCVFRFEFFSI